MLQPKRQKHPKQFRGKMKGNSQSGSIISFGEYGLKSLERSWVTAQQIEAARKTMAHYTKRAGKIWIRIFPDKSITLKPLGTRMGSGKGDINKYVCVVRPGKILFELAGVSRIIAQETMKRAAAKLPIKTKLVSLED